MMMGISRTVYQVSGRAFVLKDIDPLFYACCYLNTNQMFLMEKDKFVTALNKGRISEFSAVANF